MGIEKIFIEYLPKLGLELPHRMDGPAIIHSDGTSDWFFFGVHKTKEVNEWAKDLNIDLDNLTDDDKILIRIYFGNMP